MTMAFSTERQQVGRDVTLQVTSDPNSHIFLVAIDKGSQLLKKPNDITSELVINYCLTCIKRSQLGQRRSGPLRQVTS